jgi:hypothetical protein
VETNIVLTRLTLVANFKEWCDARGGWPAGKESGPVVVVPHDGRSANKRVRKLP